MAADIDCDDICGLVFPSSAVEVIGWDCCCSFFIFDVDPPVADDNFGFIPQLHNALGRYVYGALRYEF